ncbi:hypothetical protein ABL78_8540, partial [Leptomonas seymouri]
MGTKPLGLQRSTRAKHTVHAACVQKHARTREAQLSCLASHRLGPSPHDVRQFVSGYGDSKLLYGSAVGWGAMADTAKLKLITQHTRPHRLVTGLPATCDEESALLESASLPLHVNILRQRPMLCELAKLTENGWAQRPPQEPPPLNFRFTPISRCVMDSFATGLLEENALPPSLEREAPLQHPPYAPWNRGKAYNVPFGTHLPLDHPHCEAGDALKLAQHVASMAVPTGLPKTPYAIATDGSASLSGHCSAAAAVLVRSPFSQNPRQICTEDCGPLARSHRAESAAVRSGLQKSVLPIAETVPREHRLLHLVTDSQPH